MKTLSKGEFLKVARQKLPLQFRKVALLACAYSNAKCEGALGSKMGVRSIRKELADNYRMLVKMAKELGFAPTERIGPFEIIKHL